eukprot:COSAG05_NODE_189_length_14633_cov_44.869134_7_plen_77_part_00
MNLTIGLVDMLALQSSESKKEEFRKYLERAGVIDALTKGKQAAWGGFHGMAARRGDVHMWGCVWLLVPLHRAVSIG